MPHSIQEVNRIPRNSFKVGRSIWPKELHTWGWNTGREDCAGRTQEGPEDGRPLLCTPGTPRAVLGGTAQQGAWAYRGWGEGGAMFAPPYPPPSFKRNLRFVIYNRGRPLSTPSRIIRQVFFSALLLPHRPIPSTDADARRGGSLSNAKKGTGREGSLNRRSGTSGRGCDRPWGGIRPRRTLRWRRRGNPGGGTGCPGARSWRASPR